MKKKYDILTAIGLILGLGFIVTAILSDSATGLAGFLSFSAVSITVGGSLAAVMINFPLSKIRLLGKITASAFTERESTKVELLDQFVNLSRKARREGLLSLENEAEEIDDEFIQKGLQMVVDGIEPEYIDNILNLEIECIDMRHSENAGIFTAWGTYAPAFGMIGTLIGLIQMFAGLSDAEQLAGGMSTALLTTLYGAFFANMVFLPIANNLKFKNKQEILEKEMIVEGILAIQSGVNPRIIEEKLVSFLSPEEALIYSNRSSVSEEVTEGA